MSTSTIEAAEAGVPASRSIAGTGASIRRAMERVRLRLRLQHLLFIAFTLIAAVPIVALALWDQSVAYKHQLASVRERHLLVARNLSISLSRYVQDVKSAFALAFESGGMHAKVPGLQRMLASLNVVHVCVIGPNGAIETYLGGIEPAQPHNLPPALLEKLRQYAVAADGQPAITPLQRDAKGNPVFFLVQDLPDGKLGFGVLTNDYVLHVQRQIAFGDHGHAAVVDSTGKIIGHPFASWVQNEQDISKLSIVQEMMHGKTGVTQFFSPAMNGMMVAGYTVVPETGWGVMVPQPLAEFRARAEQVNELAMVVALVAFGAAALLSWLLSSYLARPVRQVADTAEAVLGGNEKVSVPVFKSGLIPREIIRLRVAFNTMLEDLRRRNADTTMALRQAETSSIAKSHFLANMSHEMRTPLHAVVGMIELLQQTELSPTQAHYLSGARRSGDALLALIDNVLDVSKVEAGKVELEQLPFPLPALVEGVLMMFADQAKSKGLTLTATVPDQLNLMLLGDANRLSRVLTNLVANALKFTEQGRVLIRVSAPEQDEEKVLLRFEVTDSGIGIPEAKQQTIFEAFSQADTSTTRRYGGTGLGLSIARQLCRLMGGDIGVESKVGLGSTFWFQVRLLKAPNAKTGTAPAPVESRRPPVAAPVPMEQPVTTAQRAFKSALARLGRDSARVLLVEDNPVSMLVTRALVESVGCQVVMAQNGLEAMAAYRDNPVDIVLMDCQMPEMDGYEATRAIRQIEALRGTRTPIVALTANALVGSREACLDAGMDDQMTKPLSLAELSSRILHWLSPVKNSVAAS